MFILRAVVFLLVFLTGLFVGGAGAFADAKYQLNCVEDSQFTKRNGAGDWTTAQVKLSVISAKEIQIDALFKANPHLMHIVADRDATFVSDSDARFIDERVNIGASDSGETRFTVKKSILRGRAGSVKVTFAQADESAGEEKYVWGTDTILNCKSDSEKTAVDSKIERP